MKNKQQTKNNPLRVLFIIGFLMILLIAIVIATVENGQTATGGGSDCGNDINITATARNNGFISWVLLGSRGGAMTANISIIQDSIMLATKTGSFDINDQRPVNFTLSDYTVPLSSTTANGRFQIKITALSGTNLNCGLGQTFSGTLFNYSSQDVNWKSFSDDDDVILKFDNNTGGAGTVTPNVTLISPLNNSNTTANVSFVVTSNSSNSTFQLTNVSLYLDGALNETASITGTGNITTFSKIVSLGSVHNWTARTCDSFNCSLITGNRSFTALKIYEETQDFNAQGLEGSSQIFKINISLSSGYTISSINITYNNTNTSATFSAYNSTLYQATATVNLPTVSANTNKTFNWTFLLTDATVFRSNNQVQTVLNLGLDNCSANNITILNFTMKDERTQTTLNATGDNTTIRIDLNLYSDGAKTTVANSFASLYNQTIPARVCIDNALGSSQFFMDAQVEYTANNHQIEFYNIQNYSLNATANPSQNITLYDLLSTEAQVFTITYKDATFLPVANALIQIQRKYVSEGVFKTVEIPKTDTTGKTIGNLVVNDVIYSFTVVKDGQILGVFQNVQAVCQNPAITDCTIELNSFSSSVPVTNFETAKDFSFTFYRNLTNRTVWSDFTIPSGTVANISLLVVKEDALEQEVCFSSVITSAGTLSCSVSTAFGNATVLARLYKNGELIAAKDLTIARTSQQIYGESAAILALFIIITLIGAGISDNPVYTVLFLLVGVVLLYALTLVNGTIGVGSTILWLVIAILIVAIKGTRRQI